MKRSMSAKGGSASGGKKIRKSKIKKRLSKAIANFGIPLTFGNMTRHQGRVLILVVSIIFTSSVLVLQNFVEMNKVSEPQIAVVQTKKNVVLENQIKQLVDGYPIEKMAPYIAEQDPKVAAFLVAIAKKESAWGKRKPVFNGQDCFNYWGFRLKSETMGSGGHTCFDSPQQAVATVGARIDEMVKEENIETAKDMIVWKCGYGCQDQPKSVDEKKWIKDVDMYLDKIPN